MSWFRSLDVLVYVTCIDLSVDVDEIMMPLSWLLPVKVFMTIPS